MTLVSAGVREGLARYMNELPAVEARAEVQPQDPRGAELHASQSGYLAAVDLTAVRGAPGPHHELADAVLSVYRAPRGYRGVALVAVGVSREDDVRSMVVEDLPQRVLTLVEVVFLPVA